MRIGVIVALALVAGCKGAREDTADTGERTKALPESCAAYRRALDTLPACSGVSKDELASLWRGYQDASTAWVNRDVARMPANTLRAIDVACTAGRDFIRGRIAEMCPERAERAEADFGTSKLPATCVMYGRLIDAVMVCDKLPQQSRDALKQGYEAMAGIWWNIDNLPSDSVKTIEEGCRHGGDAVRQAGESYQCQLPAVSAQLPAECSEYRDTIFKLANCDKLPQQSRDALLEGFRAMEKGWADMDVIPAEARKALADACKQGTDALKQAASATCGW